MCGLNGIYAYHPSAGVPRESELLATRDAMRVRGPDGAGEYWSPDRRCGVGHRRLAIQDLSDRASQPMTSGGGASVVVFNGEIYNYPALRNELERDGAIFRTTSDTEILLHLYERFGDAMVSKLRGMFAFAIWDETRKGLFLGRDPYGIKPLYTANDGWTFRFASQVKALLLGGAISTDPEPAGVVGFHIFGSVPEPFTLYRDIRALPAGHTQWVDRSGAREPARYHDMAAVLQRGAERRVGRNDIAACVKTAALDSVRAHLLADVDVGLFLSAGVDSGALLGLMRDAGAGRVKAITLGFSEYENGPEDEAPLAAEIAARYGAEHIVRRVAEEEFRADLPQIIEAMDQPSIDGVNMWFVAKAAREAGLKVALSGLGGDEILAGYPSFRDLPRWTTWLRAPGAVPGLGASMRRAGRALRLGAASPKSLALIEYGGSLPGAYLLRRGLFMPYELDDILAPDLVAQGLRRLAVQRRLAAAIEPDPGSDNGRVCALESTFYMRNQLLRDADWAAMAHSLEVRTPLVDSALLEALAPAVPALDARAGKTALAAAPSTALPDTITNRPKTGFTVPTGRWLEAAAARQSSAQNSAALARKGMASRAWARRIFAEPRLRSSNPHPEPAI